MVLKKVLKMVCMTLIVAGMLFAVQKAQSAYASMCAPGIFINFTAVK